MNPGAAVWTPENLKGNETMEKMNCAYCDEDEKLDAFGIKICELSASKVYLFREQSHRGRVIVASKRHVGEIVDLTKAERNAFMNDVATVASALHNAFKPQKVNYGAYGDTCAHLHFHLVPKYADDTFEWGGVFAMNPQRKTLTDLEYAELSASIAAELILAHGDLSKELDAFARRIAEDGRIDYNESTVLLRVMTPLAEGDARIAQLVAVLKDVRADGVVSPEESVRLLELIKMLNLR